MIYSSSIFIIQSHPMPSEKLFQPSEISRHSRRLNRVRDVFREEASENTEEADSDFVRRVVAEVIQERIAEIRNTRGKIHLLHMTDVPLLTPSSEVSPYQLGNRDLISKGIFAANSFVFMGISFDTREVIDTLVTGRIKKEVLGSAFEQIRKWFIHFNGLEPKKGDLGANFIVEDLIILDEREPEKKGRFNEPRYDLDAVYFHFLPQEKERFREFLRTGKKS